MRLSLASLAALALAACGQPSAPTGEEPWLSTEVLLADNDVRAEKVAYPGERGRAYGLLCRPQGGGPYPVAIVNHGGWSGLGAEWQVASSVCVGAARAGFVVVEASYRGEDGSEGAIELCLGEADDVARMLEVVLAQPYADPRRVAMFGGSHGGCVTVRALQNRVPVGRAAALNAPADMSDLYLNADGQIASGASGARLTFFQSIVQIMRSLYGGSPQERAAEYARHSTLEAADRLATSTVPLMLQHGAADDVVPVSHSCRLAAAVGGFQAYRVATDGSVIAAPPPGCAGLSLTWSSGPLPADWPARRYLVVYEGLDHAGGVSEPLRSAHMGAFLRLGAVD